MIRRPTLLRRARAAACVIGAVALSACSSSMSTESAGTARSGIPVVGGDRDRVAAATTAAARGPSEAASATTAAASATTAAAHTGGPQAAPPPVDAPPGPTERTAEDNRSTFALDVDTASYTLARAALTSGSWPDPARVRTEEFVNYLDQGYEPATDAGLTIRVDGTRGPFQPTDHRVLRVGVQGRTVDDGNRKAVTLTFLVDVSGSMADDGKLYTAQGSLQRLVASLRAGDSVEIVTFSTEADLALKRTAIEDDGVNRANEVLSALTPQESTNLEAGMALAYERARASYRPGGVNRVVLVTDGLANTGATEAADVVRRVREDAGKGIQLVALGVGFGEYDDALLEQLARDGDGFYAYVDQPAEIERLFGRRLTSTLQTVALDGKAEVRFDPEVVRSYRLLGYDDRAIPDGSLPDPGVGGGETAAGNVTTALYDVELWSAHPDPGARVATVWVHWTDPDERNGIDRRRDVTVGDLDRSFAESPVRLRQSVWVAAFAERLRGTGWGTEVSFAEVRSGLTALLEGRRDDAQLRELVDLADRAESLRG